MQELQRRRHPGSGMEVYVAEHLPGDMSSLKSSPTPSYAVTSITPRIWIAFRTTKCPAEVRRLRGRQITFNLENGWPHRRFGGGGRKSWNCHATCRVPSGTVAPTHFGWFRWKDNSLCWSMTQVIAVACNSKCLAAQEKGDTVEIMDAETPPAYAACPLRTTPKRASDFSSRVQRAA